MASPALNLKAKPSLQKIDVPARQEDMIEDFYFKTFRLFGNLSDEDFIKLNQTSMVDRDDWLDFQYAATAYILKNYGIPIVILIGCIGNIMSFCVFVASHLKFQSSSIYLAFLSVVDTAFLLCLLVSWLWQLDINLIHRQGICQTVLYFSNATGFLSVYTVVIFTIERWIIVFHPVKKNVWCTTKKARITITIISCIAFCIYSYTIWSTGIFVLHDGQSYCISKPKYAIVLQVISIIDTLITLILPAVIISLLNVKITMKIWEFVHKDNTNNLYMVSPTADQPMSRCSILLNHFNNGADETEVGANVTIKKYSRTNINSVTTYNSRSKLKTRKLKSRGKGRLHMRTTRSLLIVSSVFVVLNLPSHAFRIYIVIAELIDPTYVYPRLVLFLQHVFQLIYYLNFAVNFFLYSACSKSFRQAFYRLCLRFKRKVGIGWTKFKTLGNV